MAGSGGSRWPAWVVALAVSVSGGILSVLFYFVRSVARAAAAGHEQTFVSGRFRSPQSRDDRPFIAAHLQMAALKQ